FICSQMPNQVLQSISIIDTPGILSGEKQRISRELPKGADWKWRQLASLSRRVLRSTTSWNSLSCSHCPPARFFSVK
ncbi:hypothetical protein GOODEAATRI_013493, partial [Goodea atripinnis]